MWYVFLNMGLIYHINDYFVIGSVDILQSNTNSDFHENVLKEYFKNGDGSWFDTFIQKTLYFLDKSPFDSSHGTC